MLQITALLQKETEKTAILKKQYKEVEDTVQLVKNAFENMQKLQEEIVGFRSKLMTWQGKWEDVRSKLIEEYRNIKFSSSQREVEIVKKREEIQKMRAEIKQLVDQAKEKDNRYKELVKTYKEMEKSREKKHLHSENPSLGFYCKKI